MKISQLFTKTSKDYPKDEQSVSAQLLLRAGYIDKVAAGVYTLLPLGFRVASKIITIIRGEMDEAGGQEILMPGLVPKSLWEKSGRWDNFDALFRLKGVDDKEYGLGATHEEIVTPLGHKFTFSYKDLPFAVYQIQNKFRNETRAKSGVLRTREFLMKDLYSFHQTEKDLDNYYEKITTAYWKIFESIGIKEKTHLTYASGGTFSKFSHEFQTETEAGEDEIYVCVKCGVGLNREILENTYRCPECGSEEYEIKKCVEVGNIFKLRTKYSEPFSFLCRDESGEEKPVEMGCYGIGIQRLMGTVAELYHDQGGLVWPDKIAPFLYHLIVLGDNQERADEVYRSLKSMGVEVLYDDRELSAGEKFADADLIGIPNRLVVSDKTEGRIELKKRSEKESDLVDLDDLTKAV